MNTPFTDANAWYGEYVRKSAPVVHASKVRELEEASNDLSIRAQMAEGEIERAHRALDDIGAPRLQENGLTYSLEGRLRVMRPNQALDGRTERQEP
jgi:hypothetical protein